MIADGYWALPLRIVPAGRSPSTCAGNPAVQRWSKIIIRQPGWHGNGCIEPGNRIWSSMLPIGCYDPAPAAVIPEKSGIQRIPGTGQPAFGQTVRIPACAGKTIAGEA